MILFDNAENKTMTLTTMLLCYYATNYNTADVSHARMGNTADTIAK